MFYGSNSFLLTLFDLEKDMQSIEDWLKTIGSTSAGMLRRVKLVYRTRSHQRDIRKNVLPMMVELGVQKEAVEVMRLKVSFVSCD